jgi:hypothetical protein
MLKMETDDYVDTQPISNSQQPDLLKMCRSRYVARARWAQEFLDPYPNFLSKSL